MGGYGLGLVGPLGRLDTLVRDDRYPGCGRYSRGYRPSKYSFVSKLTANRLPTTSKYMPHQGERECARRRRAMGVI